MFSAAFTGRKINNFCCLKIDFLLSHSFCQSFPSHPFLSPCHSHLRPLLTYLYRCASVANILSSFHLSNSSFCVNFFRILFISICVVSSALLLNVHFYRTNKSPFSSSVCTSRSSWILFFGTQVCVLDVCALYAIHTDLFGPLLFERILFNPLSHFVFVVTIRPRAEQTPAIDENRAWIRSSNQSSVCAHLQLCWFRFLFRLALDHVHRALIVGLVASRIAAVCRDFDIEIASCWKLGSDFAPSVVICGASNSFSFILNFSEKTSELHWVCF